MAFDIYDENRRVGLVDFTNLCSRIQSVYIQYCMMLYTTVSNYYLLYIITIWITWTNNYSCSDLVLEKYDVS